MGKLCYLAGEVFSRSCHVCRKFLILHSEVNFKQTNTRKVITNQQEAKIVENEKDLADVQTVTKMIKKKKNEPKFSIIGVTIG